MLFICLHLPECFSANVTHIGPDTYKPVTQYKVNTQLQKNNERGQERRPKTKHKLKAEFHIHEVRGTETNGYNPNHNNNNVKNGNSRDRPFVPCIKTCCSNLASRVIVQLYSDFLMLTSMA